MVYIATLVHVIMYVSTTHTLRGMHKSNGLVQQYRSLVCCGQPRLHEPFSHWQFFFIVRKHLWCVAAFLAPSSSNTSKEWHLSKCNKWWQEKHAEQEAQNLAAAASKCECSGIQHLSNFPKFTQNHRQLCTLQASLTELSENASRSFAAHHPIQFVATVNK